MEIREIGEVRLIEHLTGLLGQASWGGSRGVVRGIGDDAAVLQVTPGRRLLVSCDALVEGRHFDFNYYTPYQVGRKALAVNISDIAAMGGQPRWALFSLVLPPRAPLQVVEGIYQGIADLALKEGVAVVGGDTTSSDGPLVVDVIILGEAGPESVAYRSGAVPGDYILVTGHLGSSAAGLLYLQHPEWEEQLSREQAAPLLEAHLNPPSRCRLAMHLVENWEVVAMIDLSDGLAAGLLELASASEVGARVYAERLPLLPELELLARLSRRDPYELALYGGEDYELLFTVGGRPGAGRKVRRLIRQLQRLTGTRITVIGQVTDLDAGVKLIRPGDMEEEIKLEKCYNHFG